MMQMTKPDGSYIYESGRQCFRVILKTEGIEGFYQGNLLCRFILGILYFYLQVLGPI